MLLFDAHLDISMNAAEWTRGLTRPLEEIRNRNALMLDKLGRGKGILTFEEITRLAKIFVDLGGTCQRFVSFMDLDLYPQGFEAGLTLLVDL